MIGMRISWEQIAIGLVVVLTGYYLVWWLVFYRHGKTPPDLTKPIVWKKEVVPPTGVAVPAIPIPPAPATPMSLVHELMEECKQVWVAAKKDSLSKGQVQAALRFRLEKYSALKGTPFQWSIGQHIIQEVKQQLQMEFSIDEINALW